MVNLKSQNIYTKILTEFINFDKGGSMKLFIKNAKYLWQGGDSELLQDISILVNGSKIEKIGNSIDLAKYAGNCKTINAENMIVLPGLVNTHHHFYQTLTRNLPKVQNSKLFDWLINLYPVWSNLTEDDFYLSTKIATLELLQSGCTTAVDHSYLVPKGQENLYYKQVQAAKETGIRFHLCRGSMSRSKKDGGLPPDSVVQKEDQILAETQKLYEKVHEPQEGGMIRIIVGPCSPFSVTKELMIESKKWASKNNLHVHTHLAETTDEAEYCKKVYGCSPFEFMEQVGWIDKNSFFAHSIYLSNDEIISLGKAKGGVAHCPTSNMRLGSGIMPLITMLKNGVNVGLGVDGSASNDSSNMLLEVRLCMLLQRVAHGANVISAKEVLKLATIGGAEVLGRTDIGYIKPGYEADIIGINLDQLPLAGSVSDPLASIVFCGINKVDLCIVHGELLINNGRFTRFSDEEILDLIHKQNNRALELLKIAQH